MAKLIFGCGYLGLRVATRWIEQGHEVYAVTRSPERGEYLRNLGVVPLVADVTERASLKQLPVAETAMYAVGHDRTAGKTIHEVYVDGLRNALAALPRETGRIVYVSSTGVYGQSEGEWVDENSPCNPTREGGRACLEAETLLRSHSLGVNSIILRMGGIYGPGRIPRRADIEGAKPIPASEQGYLNLIHVDDATAVVLAAERHATPPALYTVTDGNPVLRGDYFRELAKLMNAPPPTFQRPPETSSRATRASTDKRVSNQNMLNHLKVQLTYPTYRQGLAAILSNE